MSKKEALQNEEIWWRMGAELDFLYNFALQILCDGDYQTIMTKEILNPISRICALNGIVSRVRNKAEIRMFAKTNFGNITAFYPSRESVKAIEKEVERAREALSALGRRFMEEENDGYAGLEDMSLDEAIQNAVNVMERLDAKNAEETT